MIGATLLDDGFRTPDSPFATRTIANLLDRQGHGNEAAAIRRELTYPREERDARL